MDMAGYPQGSFDAMDGAAPRCVSSDDVNNMNTYLANNQSGRMSDRHLLCPPPLPSSDGQAQPRRESTDGYAPSSSTSPYLANSVAFPKDSRLQPSDLLPSPTPSDDFSMEPPTFPYTKSPDNIDEMSRPPTQPTTASMDAVRKRAAATGFDQITNKRHASGSMSAARPNTPQRQVSGPAGGSYNFIRPQLMQLYGAQSRPEPQTNFQALDASRAQAQAMSQSNVSEQWQKQPRFQNGTSIMPIPISDPNYYSLAYCEALFMQVMKQVGGQLSNYDRSRLRVVEEAIKVGDYAYLTVHQYYCMATYNLSDMPKILCNLPELPRALEYLGDVLGPNRQLSQVLHQWFANFPKPLMEIARDYPRRYDAEQQAFITFSQFLATRYVAFKQICIQRRWPPLARELYDVLAIRSNSLGKIVYRSLRRCIWHQNVGRPVEDTAWEIQADFLFGQNQRAWLARWTTHQTTGYVGVGSDQEDENFGRRLISLLIAHETFMKSQQRGPQLLPQFPSTQGAPNNDPPLGLYAAPQPNADPNQNSRNAPPASSVANLVLQPQPPRGAGRPRLNDTPRGTEVRGPGEPRRGPRLDATTQAASNTPTQASSTRRVAQAVPVPPGNVQQSHKPTKRLLFPAANNTPGQPIDPDPAQTGVHQAHLRSPNLTPNLGLLPTFSHSLFRYVKGFAISPRTLSSDPASPTPPIQIWKFSINDSAFALIPKPVMPKNHEVPPRIIDETTQTYRLRCIKWKPNKTVSEPDWFTADASWIPTTFFKLNGKALEPRKKLHHGMDLPIDLTELVQEGENQLEIVSVRSPNLRFGAVFDYALAIEIVGVQTYEEIGRQCIANRKPAEDVLNAIKTSLAGLHSDDDISIVRSNISITIFDPISAYKIFDIPVRGRDCLHHDCFDLDTFLKTRKRKQLTWPTAVDNWRCPICKADVRPPNLFVDGFMVKVRKTLAEKNLLGTRAIIVNPDGTWGPKPEQRDKNSVRDPDTRDESRPVEPQRTESSGAQSTPVILAARPPSERIVIYLDN